MCFNSSLKALNIRSLDSAHGDMLDHSSIVPHNTLFPTKLYKTQSTVHTCLYTVHPINMKILLLLVAASAILATATLAASLDNEIATEEEEAITDILTRLQQLVNQEEMVTNIQTMDDLLLNNEEAIVQADIQKNHKHSKKRRGRKGRRRDDDDDDDEDSSSSDDVVMQAEILNMVDKLVGGLLG